MTGFQGMLREREKAQLALSRSRQSRLGCFLLQSGVMGQMLA
ncbi:hypothetical protein ACN4EG_05970 [Alkalinema pantanalense CENA528]